MCKRDRDNVIAANAYTKTIVLIWVGVFIGILAMRFVAQGFVKLMEKYPFLDTCAYIVIGLLGAKLTLSLVAPVSYTHLDVYKRQALSGTTGQPVF